MNDFTTREDPFALFAEWLKEAEAGEPNDPTAMSVASVDRTGMPDVRTILLKGHDAKGFVFYTNFESAKGREILGTKWVRGVTTNAGRRSGFQVTTRLSIHEHNSSSVGPSSHKPLGFLME